MAKKKKKKKLKIKNIIIGVVLLSLIGYTFYWILKLPINNIYVSGNKILEEKEILSLANLEDYPSFLLTTKSEIKNNIKKNHYVKEVTVKKSFGNKIYIEIEEYMPLCILENNKLLLSSGEELENTYNLTDIPYLVTAIEDKTILKSFTEKFSKIDENILRQISQIEYIPVEVDKERFLLYMDDGNEVYITLTKIEKINKYNKIVEKMDGSHGIIYLDSGDYVEIKNITDVINTDTGNTNSNSDNSNQTDPQANNNE